MNDIQQAIEKSLDRVNDFNTDLVYGPIISAIPEYMFEKNIFDTARGIISGASIIQATDTTGKKVSADALKAALAKTVFKYESLGRIKAEQLGNIDLAKDLDHTVTYILEASKQEAITRSSAIRALLNDNLPSLTNISAGNIGEIDTAISAFQGAKEQPTEAIGAKKAAGTNPLPPAFQTANKAMDNMFTILFVLFHDSNPTMVDALHLAMDQTVYGRGHNNAHFDILDINGDPFFKLNIQLFNLDNTPVKNKSALTDLTGYAPIDKVKTGKYQAEISGPNIATKRIPIKIERGKTLQVHLQLPRI